MGQKKLTLMSSTGPSALFCLSKVNMYPRDRVWMIGWEYPPHNSGGLGVACQGLTQSLAQSNTQIYFTLPYAFSGNVSHMELIECIHESWNSDPNAAPFSAYSSIPSLDTSGFGRDYLDTSALAALPQSHLEVKVGQYAQLVSQQAAKRNNPFEVIHAHDWMSFPAGVQLKRQSGKPLITHIHSTEYDRIPSGHGSDFIMHTEYEGLQQADKVIAVSNYTKYLLVRHYNVDPNKIEVVHNGLTPSDSINPGTQHFASKRPVIVFMGRLTGQKGPEYMLALAKQLLQKIPDALLILAGSGDLYHELLITTARERLSASVLFSGFLRDQQREKLLDRADIFVMPSLSEPFGLVALEAAERHTPVIVSKNSGVAEVLPSAISIDFWDIQKMTDTIYDLLTNQVDRQKVVEQQLADVQKVTWQSAAQKVKNVYRSIVKK